MFKGKRGHFSGVRWSELEARPHSTADIKNHYTCTSARTHARAQVFRAWSGKHFRFYFFPKTTGIAVAVSRFCVVRCVIIMGFSLLFSNYSTSVFFNIPFMFVFLFCIFVFYFVYSVSFLFLYKSTDHCRRVETQW